MTESDNMIAGVGKCCVNMVKNSEREHIRENSRPKSLKVSYAAGAKMIQRISILCFACCRCSTKELGNCPESEQSKNYPSD